MNKFFLYFAAASIGGVSSLHAGKTPQIKHDELKHLSAQPAPAPAEGAARNVDQRDFDDPDYGGIRGHQLFLEDRPTIIKNLVQLLLKYKGRCEFHKPIITGYTPSSYSRPAGGNCTAFVGHMILQKSKRVENSE